MLKKQKDNVRVKLSEKKNTHTNEEKREFITREKFKHSHIDAIF